MAQNGRLPASDLASIGGGYYLRKDAAAAFNAMSNDAYSRWGSHITVVAGYRDINRQWYFWNLYQSGRGNLAAYPGTSNHGWGLAVDLASSWARWAVDQIGRHYGFSKGCSDAQSEWWHIVWNPLCTGATWKPGPSGPRVLKYGMTGHDVHDMQVWLVRSGIMKKAKPGQPPAIDGVFGRSTHGAVVAFQKAHHLNADGVAGPTTLGLLKKLYGSPWPKK